KVNKNRKLYSLLAKKIPARPRSPALSHSFFSFSVYLCIRNPSGTHERRTKTKPERTITVR
ncbi:hypothetical protein, partial [Duncaniella muris]|uniref:hypothetical protein n=1 Tax=Duncaniella muris TaxID=2094150 RepID=UPI0025AF1B4A